MNFTETEQQRDLRAAVAQLGRRYGFAYANARARRHEPLRELWQETGKLGFTGVNLPVEYGGGGGGMYELAIVQEELSAAGCGLLMLVVSPAICGTVISRYGTEQQKQRWLPGIADGSAIMAFGITESEAGSNSHRITTTARRDGGDWVLSGSKVYISGVDQANHVLIVGRTEDTRTGRLKPVLFAVPTDAPGFRASPIDMDVVMAERQFGIVLDGVRLPAEALIGEEDAALAQLFAGLNPERIMASALAVGIGRYALERAVDYAKQRSVFGGAPIATHQGVAHPLAQIAIEVELARLMMQKAAGLYDAGDDTGAAEAANMAKYAAAEASIRAVDQALQTHGGNGLASEYGLATLLAAARVARIAPVSREMILNFVAQSTLGMPKSY
ncbi:acyl-CoA/acyl-ACP dehydrogenase [Streptacidiphilus sp. PB12-B1b]|uniref:acyl-CoA dehydrogenase family protein n=1 Tax=Streptacidiphilus sp. PB12-B1b TaxID=2705012 RepID=UPI0015FC0904|nr:acyl-CoA dehydrogenase family protein [Streptacidiphilus sp. PB12-B1b]QMU77456.1 acyl-CoA/acyl-ACP dehydrogenase [Streptacidiphilus sp. PB12-B1b]